MLIEKNKSFTLKLPSKIVQTAPIGDSAILLSISIEHKAGVMDVDFGLVAQVSLNSISLIIFFTNISFSLYNDLFSCPIIIALLGKVAFASVFKFFNPLKKSVRDGSK
jgi:hypothetical protein